MTGRPTTLATEGMVATPHYLASVAGLRALQSGGNAVDAAIAANAVLTVVYPHMCSIGGDAFLLIWDPNGNRLHALNGSGRSPVGVSRAALEDLGLSTVPARGAHPVTVPGAVHAWETVLGRFGTRSLGEVLAPAIDYAERGFPVSPGLSAAIARAQDVLASQDAAAKQFLPGGQVPDPGQLLPQPDLAGSLRQIGANGAEAFYHGSIAKAIVKTVQAGGAFLDDRDLAEHQSEWVEPLSTTYRGVELVELPPNTQGVTSLQLANIAEGLDISAMGHNTAKQIHHLVEAKKLAFQDRDRHVSDPAFVDIPVRQLISKQYADDLRGRISPTQATSPGGDPAGGGDTIYLCVVDRDGLCVSLIQSIFIGFGSGLVADGAGIVLQNRGASFTLDPDAANRLEPRKRPLHTLIPAMLLRDGQPWVVFGTMGGHGQAQTHLQLLCNLVDFGMEPQAAIEAPRWVSGRGLEQDPPHVLYLEEGLDASVIDQLRIMGHDARATEPFSSLMGHAQMIQIDRTRGILMGAADPRADGYALGW